MEIFQYGHVFQHAIKLIMEKIRLDNVYHHVLLIALLLKVRIIFVLLDVLMNLLAILLKQSLIPVLKLLIVQQVEEQDMLKIQQDLVFYLIYLHYPQKQP